MKISNRKKITLLLAIFVACSSFITHPFSSSKAVRLSATALLIVSATRLLFKKSQKEQPQLPHNANLFKRFVYFVDNVIIGQKEKGPYQKGYVPNNQGGCDFIHDTIPARGIGGYIHKYWKNVAAIVGIAATVNKLYSDAEKWGTFSI